MPADVISVIVFLWLCVCMLEDVRNLEVPNILTVPMIVAMLILRLRHPDVVAFVAATLFFLLGFLALIPGGDAKGLIAISLYSPEVLVFCLFGAGLVKLFCRNEVHTPGYLGFFTGGGMILFLYWMGVVNIGTLSW